MIPDKIVLKDFDESFVYKGEPIEVKIKFDFINEEPPCFALIPCPNDNQKK